MSHENYISRTPHLLKSFDRAISLVKPVLIARYGEEANALIQASRQKYCDLIPQIPYIGENNPLVDVFYLPASRHLGIYKAFQERDVLRRLKATASQPTLGAIAHVTG